MTKNQKKLTPLLKGCYPIDELHVLNVCSRIMNQKKTPHVIHENLKLMMLIKMA